MEMKNWKIGWDVENVDKWIKLLESYKFPFFFFFTGSICLTVREFFSPLRYRPRESIYV